MMYLALGDSKGWKRISRPRLVGRTKLTSNPFGIEIEGDTWRARKSATVEYVYILDEDYEIVWRSKLGHPMHVVSGDSCEVTKVQLNLIDLSDDEPALI